MNEIAVAPPAKRIKLSQPLAAVGTDLPNGLALAKEILDAELLRIRNATKGEKSWLEPERMRATRDAMAIYESYTKIEAQAAKSDRQRTALESLTEDQLDEAIAAYEKGKR